MSQVLLPTLSDPTVNVGIEATQVCALEPVPTGGTRISLARGTSEITTEPFAFVQGTVAANAALLVAGGALLPTFLDLQNGTVAINPFQAVAVERASATASRVSVDRGASSNTDGPFLTVQGTVAAVAAALSAAIPATVVVGPGNVVYVATAAAGGNDATGARGNAGRPFATIAAAVAAAQSGDEIRIGPGVFTISATVQIALPELHLLGSGMLATRLVGAAALGASPALRITNAARRLSVRDLTIDTSAVTGECVLIVGTGGGGATLNQGAVFEDLELRCDPGVSAIDSINACAAGVGMVRNVRVIGTGLAFSSSLFHVRECVIDGTLSIGYVVGADAPTRSVQIIEGCFIGTDLNIEDAINVAVAADTIIGGNVTGILTQQGANDPELLFRGQANSLTLTLPDTASALSVDISDAEFLGVTFSMTAPAANPQTILATGLRLPQPGVLRANAGVNIIARDSNLTGAQLSTPDATGSVTITQASFPATAIGVGAGTSIGLGWRSGAPPIDVAIAPLVVATGPCALDAPSDTDTNVQLIATVAGSVTFTVFW